MLPCRLNHDSNSLLRSDVLEKVNISIASACLATLLATAIWFWRRVLQARRAGVVWGRTRRFILIMTSVDLCLHLVNLSAYLSANVYSLLVC